MKQYAIKLPLLKWFKCGKVFTGSMGTDPNMGCMNRTTFNYRVGISNTKEGEILAAVCFFKLPWNAKIVMQEFYTGIFESSEAGIEVAEYWILSKYFVPPEEASKLLPEKLYLTG